MEALEGIINLECRQVKTTEIAFSFSNLGLEFGNYYFKAMYSVVDFCINFIIYYSFFMAFNHDEAAYLIVSSSEVDFLLAHLKRLKMPKINPCPS